MLFTLRTQTDGIQDGVPERISRTNGCSVFQASSVDEGSGFSLHTIRNDNGKEMKKGTQEK
jgi:hypothetical protein